MADGSVRAMKWGNAHRAKGPWIRSNGQSGDNQEIDDESNNSEKKS